MRTQFSKLALAAALVLALVFTFSCSNDDGGDSNSSKIVYGPSVNYGGETYKTVVIGTQTWMARNLNYGSYRYCYDNLNVNCNKYGGLYDWATAMALPESCNTSYCSSQIRAKHQGICPPGWHIPSAEEWTTLTDFVGNNAGTKLKAISGWGSNGNGTDAYGFSALPGGLAANYVGFNYGGQIGFWWGSSETSTKKASYLRMKYDSEGASYMTILDKDFFISVRCLKD